MPSQDNPQDNTVVPPVTSPGITTDPAAPPVIIPVPTPAQVDATPTFPTDTPTTSIASFVPDTTPANPVVDGGAIDASDPGIEPVNPVDSTGSFDVADAGDFGGDSGGGDGGD